MENTTRQFKILNNRGIYLNICEGQSIENPAAILIQIHGIGGHFQFIFDNQDLFEYKNFIFSKKSIKSYGLELTGHGKSDGEKCSIDKYDDLIEDIRCIVIYLNNIYPDKKIFIYGESMGAGLSIIYQIKYNLIGSKVNGYILMAPMCGITKKIKPNLFLINFLIFLSRIYPNLKFLDVNNNIIESALNKDYLEARLKNKYQYNEKIRLNTARELYYACNFLENNINSFSSPLYLFHSVDDPITSCQESVKFFKNVKNNNKRIYLTKNSNHIFTVPKDLEDKRPDEVLDKMSNFIKSLC